jgi:hypothetical protein
MSNTPLGSVVPIPTFPCGVIITVFSFSFTPKIISPLESLFLIIKS